ncbi:MAG TPA: hypothetical protein VHQ42_04200, partial [Candidatus Limnocylindria bacterium]|nr:hypothetical protein [Candidatus Limnocylindria bacterium]
GGGGGGGGGGGTTAPAARQAAPAATPEPEPKVMSIGALQRPRSAAGVDGVASVVAPSGRSSVAALVARFSIDDLEGWQDRADRGPAKGPAPVMVRAPLEVSAAPSSGGPFDGLLNAVFGFLFG